MIDTEKIIIEMLNLKNKGVTYSMKGARDGSDLTADCSGALYDGLRAAGGTDFGSIPSTETLHGYLLKNGFELIADNRDWKMQRGDIIIWGKKGYSAGSYGHTGIATNETNWLECTIWNEAGPNGGIIESNHDQRLAMLGFPHWYVYRQKAAHKKTQNEEFTSDAYVSVVKMGLGKVRLVDDQGEPSKYFLSKNVSRKIIAFTKQGIQVGNKKQILPYKFAKLIIDNGARPAVQQLA